MRSLIKSFLLIANLVIVASTTTRRPIGAVVTSHPKCAEVGASILKKGGTAVDAAIAALFCEGVVLPNSMGVGGGFFMTLYKNENKEIKCLDSREVAPAKAIKDMFRSNQKLAQRGGLSVAVPGEMAGYWEAYKAYGGKVPWKDLVQPTIDLCKTGSTVSEYFANVLTNHKDVIMADEMLKETFIDKKTNSTYTQGQVILRPRLAKTLEVIAELGPDALYRGTLTQGFVKDIQKAGGIITEDDLASYKPIWKTPIEIKLPFDQTLYAPPLPSGGVIVGFIINLLNDFLDLRNFSTVENMHRIIESFKFGFAERTELGDSDFENMTEVIAKLTSKNFADKTRAKICDCRTRQNPQYYGAQVAQAENHGTNNVCVIAPNGDAVVVTSTINLDFGAGLMSKSTGIILNGHMDDFCSPDFHNVYGVPPSPYNYIQPGKRPVSSVSPSIVVDKDKNVRLALGGTGGTRIITAIVQTMIKHLWFNYSIKDAVAEPRIHHQLFPMSVRLENGFSNNMDLVNALQSMGHAYVIDGPSDGFMTVNAISKENGILSAASDWRRGGGESYVYDIIKKCCCKTKLQ